MQFRTFGFQLHGKGLIDLYKGGSLDEALKAGVEGMKKPRFSNCWVVAYERTLPLANITRHEVHFTNMTFGVEHDTGEICDILPLQRGVRMSSRG
jgi:hypothetical protein